MNQLPPSLSRWNAWDQFVLVKLVPRDNGKADKIPVDVSGIPISAHDPAHWMSAATAFATAEALNFLVGFVFTDSDPFFFIDLDHCIENGVYNEPANTIIGMFPGAAIELSQSGTGVHIFGTILGTAPPHSKKDDSLGIEYYTEGRFVLLTGNEAPGTSVETEFDMTALTDAYFPPKEGDITDWRWSPVEEWNGPEDDDILISKILNQHRFGNKASPADLWHNNEPVLAINYPSETDVYNRSGADAALASHLAWWTGKNHDRIWKLMCRSNLVREKWNVKGYLERTIKNAVNHCTSVYTNQRTSGVEQQPQTGADSTQNGNDSSSGVNRTSGNQFMSVEQQMVHFADCYYITQIHRVLTPKGSLLKPEQFKTLYGGYTFAMDSQNERTVRNAWEAFTESQAVRFPKVDRTMFDPLLPAHQIIEREGVTMVNNYVPLNIKRTPGDVSLFTTHIEKLFPDPSDRAVILAYMAAMVQYQGVKFQWCPVIQGVEGNGKTLINRCLENAIGSRYCHYPNAADLAGGGLKFNGWIENVIFVAIEEMYTGHARFDLMDAMKPMITNDMLEIQRKGADQYTGKVVANFIMNTNHKDALKITYDQRRYWMNYTAQQTRSDLIRDGMDSQYFARLYDWLKKEDGYAMVTDYLHNYQIPPELNPAGTCQRAPGSTSEVEAVYTSLGPAQQYIVEAVEEGTQGFKGGYISSYAVAALLKAEGIKMGPRVVSKMICELGYVRLGRVGSPILNEGGKPSLYLKEGLAPVSEYHLKQDYETKQGYVSPGENQ